MMRIPFAFSSSILIMPIVPARSELPRGRQLIVLFLPLFCNHSRKGITSSTFPSWHGETESIIYPQKNKSAFLLRSWLAAFCSIRSATHAKQIISLVLHVLLFHINPDSSQTSADSWCRRTAYAHPLFYLSDRVRPHCFVVNNCILHLTKSQYRHGHESAFWVLLDILCAIYKFFLAAMSSNAFSRLVWFVLRREDSFQRKECILFSARQVVQFHKCYWFFTSLWRWRELAQMQDLSFWLWAAGPYHCQYHYSRTL